MKHNFKVGDRVRILHSQDALDSVVGTEGTVCHIREGDVGVEHDVYCDRMHDCRGYCINGHGWYYYNAAYKLEKIDAEPLRIDTLDGLI